jgi:hypothetical protein
MGVPSEEPGIEAITEDSSLGKKSLRLSKPGVGIFKTHSFTALCESAVCLVISFVFIAKQRPEEGLLDGSTPCLHNEVRRKDCHCAAQHTQGQRIGHDDELFALGLQIKSNTRLFYFLA